MKEVKENITEVNDDKKALNITQVNEDKKAFISIINYILSLSDEELNNLKYKTNAQIVGLFLTGKIV